MDFHRGAGSWSWASLILPCRLKISCSEWGNSSLGLLAVCPQSAREREGLDFYVIFMPSVPCAHIRPYHLQTEKRAYTREGFDLVGLFTVQVHMKLHIKPWSLIQNQTCFDMESDLCNWTEKIITINLWFTLHFRWNTQTTIQNIETCLLLIYAYRLILF